MRDSKTIKKRLTQLGTDICGIGSVSRFSDAPKGFQPVDIYPDCKSVIVFACRFPLSTLKANTNSPYTFVRNMMVNKLDQISFRLSEELERNDIGAMPIPSAEPYDYWDPEERHGRGVLSLKHAASLAGLGVIGKNTLLVNNKFGNMIWLGAVLASIELESDPIASYEGCINKCTICIDSCPQKALNGITLDQKSCRERSISSTEGGGWILSCNICRKICPNHKYIVTSSKRENTN